MKVQFTTRIESDILESAKTIATKERRSLNNTIEFLLSMAIDIYGDGRMAPLVNNNSSVVNLKTESN